MIFIAVSVGTSMLARATSVAHLTPDETQSSLPLQRPLAQTQPKDDGHILPDPLLDSIYSIECLKVKQRDPKAICGSHRHKTPDGPLDVGNWPHWQSGICHSGGEYFCDPGNVVKGKARKQVLKELQLVREEQQVTCGQMDSAMKGFDATTTRPFNLGVLVIDEWPSQEADEATLDKLGLVVMGRWGLYSMYNGVDAFNNVNEYYSWNKYRMNCPNTAMLILLPRYRQAVLSAPSCEFICRERGGPEVAGAMLMALDSNGPEAAILAGVEEVKRVLRETTPLSTEPSNRAYVRRFRRGSWQERFFSRESTWAAAQRGIFAVAMILIIVGLIAFVYYNFCVPQTVPMGKILLHAVDVDCDGPRVYEPQAR